ncbi:putative 2-oxoglutarate/Fe(II)-dependent dioxygenase YbiX [Bradyrhizobium sp. USDA 4524]|uniref:2OG-Fe(II) oxygenase n=1 Tax=unclassified Bradyrhizobium TaxID=2631580 RepID=UPI0020A1456E|nr:MULTISPECIES: 2OG-Fe(II) oxygenase [unclassified Bradyrhizobium]MCP1846169.1 putative 2-oxoglutarate/Fe(II)-dependent dioxygenase YbiX [Bradyrhizobium sp. USDA 4538]MCP1907196.1 putative 2-oxoglutarate/Fe(II)-dependent dioxygenase YbiX [Bradyrhizobium sp. USDA 4537]MCP1985672.1 putative 2-oxoglutarate/Fe(II)-dependent dioxygenase YbiX [Bradyrhizobium sp. USDA 4539]
MSSIGTRLLNSLRSVERPGDFCVGGIREIFMPTIDVDGVGRLAFPVLPAQAERLVAIAEAAPFGRGEETLVDREVRRTWQVDSANVRIAGRHWDKTLAGLVADIARRLGVGEPVAADFYKLLVYDTGSFFVDHRDTEKVAGMFATLVLILPSAHSGGELIVKHLGREVVLELRPEEPSEIGFAAFYADCVHEVRPVKTGWRLTLVYNLRFAGTSRALKAPDYRAEHGQVVELLRTWAGAEDEPDKLILPLEHVYTPAELSFGALKGADAGVASVLAKAAADANCDLHLALVSIEEGGSAEHSPYFGRRNRLSRDDEEFEVAEIFDRALILSEWRRPDGGEAGFGDFPFAEDELCPADAFENLMPDEQHFHEATGNEGASFERAYRRAGLVLWPAARRLAVLNQAGLGTTLPYLEDLTARWEASDASISSPLWHEADELSGHMLRSWPRTSRADDDVAAGRMLDLQIRLGNVGRIDALLAELSAEGHYAAPDNGSIVRAVALLPASRATELLIRIVSRNASAHLSACGDLLSRCVAAPAGLPLEQIGQALIDAMPGDPTTQQQVDVWTRPAPVKPGFVVDLLTATSRIDAGLAARAIQHLMAWPKTYKPDDVLVPAALAIAKLEESRAWPVVARLREAALNHLHRRIALPLEAPRDWTRTNPLKCTCGDCRGLGAFLTAPDQQQWRLKAVQDRRTHVEQRVRSATCDLDLATERRGSPHTLVATKNQASYERRARQRRQDLEHVSALGG